MLCKIWVYWAVTGHHLHEILFWTQFVGWKTLHSFYKCCRKYTYRYGTCLINILICTMVFEISVTYWQSYQSLCDELFFSNFQDTSFWNPHNLRYLTINNPMIGQKQWTFYQHVTNIATYDVIDKHMIVWPVYIMTIW